MSSSDSGQEAGGSRKPTAKKRRTNLACDMCKKRKIRCDGKIASGKCSNCNEFDWKCTYDNASKKYPPGYVLALQTKVEKLEALLHELHPDEDFTSRVGGPLTRSNWMQKGALGDLDPEKQSAFVVGSSKDSPPSQAPAISHSPAASHSSAASSSPHPLLVGNTTVPTTEPVNDEDDVVVKLNKLSQKLKQTHIGNFYGRSSNKALIMSALALDKELGSVPNIESAPDALFNLLRPEFWEEQPWEDKYNELTLRPHQFPEPDLLARLVDLYFDIIHIHLPILHQPTFRQGLREQLHLSSRDFGAVVLLVCATASRFCDDPRVLLPGTNSGHSAGYQWFAQVSFACAITPMADATLLQALAIGVLYLQGKSEMTAWNVCGAAIRLAQNLGIHRKPAYDAEPSIKDELFKRSFWALILFDRHMSLNLGRACAIVDDDLDLDFPLDVDDDYWVPADESQAFKQPEGRPSRISAFIWVLKLSQIMGSALRTLHASNKTKAHHGFTGPEWERRAIAFYDSTLNQWLESLPEYLRWDPDSPPEDPVLFQQAIHVMARFYEMQIIIHRPFIASERTSALPSLAICSNAARSCARIMETVRQRFPGCIPQLYTCAFTSGAVLLYNIGSARRLRTPVNPEDLGSVQICMNFLKSMEAKYQSAGRVWDALNMIVSLGRLPLDEKYLRGQKRQREAGDSGHPPDTSGPSTDNPAPAWIQSASSYPESETQAAQSADWNASAAGAFSQDVDMTWLAQFDQASLPGRFDVASMLGSGAGQSAPLGDTQPIPNHWPFGSESDLLGGGMNPSQMLGDLLVRSEDPINHVYMPPGPSDFNPPWQPQ